MFKPLKTKIRDKGDKGEVIKEKYDSLVEGMRIYIL